MDELKLPPPGRCACTNLRSAARAITQFYDQMLEPSGLRATQYSILAALARAGDMTIIPLADQLVMDRTTLTRNLSRLEKYGWIRIEPGEDLRTRIVHLTDEGRAVLAKALPLWQEAQTRVVGGLGEGQFHVLLGQLSAVVSLVQERP